MYLLGEGGLGTGKLTAAALMRHDALLGDVDAAAMDQEPLFIHPHTTDHAITACSEYILLIEIMLNILVADNLLMLSEARMKGNYYRIISKC